MDKEELGLLDAARAGNASALANLMRHYQDAVYRFGRAMCGSEADAKDVTQDTLITVLQRVGEFRGEASFRSWLYAIARSQCSRRRRKTKREVELETQAARQVADPAPSAVDRLTESAERGAVQAAIATLPDKYREVLVLRDMEGMTAPEVADTLDLSVQAVKSRLHRARAMLRKELLKTQAPTRPGCPDVVGMLSRHLEDELTGEDCARMEKHLDACPQCKQTCDALRQLLGACRQAGHEPAPPEVQAAVAELLNRSKLAP